MGIKSLPLRVSHHHAMLLLQSGAHVVQPFISVVSPLFKSCDVKVEPLLDVAGLHVKVIQLPRDVRKAAVMTAEVRVTAPV